MWISSNTVKALCTLPCTSSNPELFDYIFKLNRGTRACMKSEWQYKRWNNIYPRCTKCFRPGKQGDCEICCIPKSVYQLDDTTWKKQRCIIGHCNKEHTNAILYGDAYYMMKFIMIFKPKEIPILKPLCEKKIYIAAYLHLRVDRLESRVNRLHIHRV